MTVTYHVLTGAPGSGKTAVLEALPDAFLKVPEPAREVLAEAKRGAPPSEMTYSSFVDRLLQRSIAKYRERLEASRTVVFDRAVPDCIAYACHLGTDPDPSVRAAHRYRYRGTVFMLEPWPEIYTTDDERTMSFELTVSFQGHLEAAYRSVGYDPVVVPRGSVAERAGFVSARVGAQAG